MMEIAARANLIRAVRKFLRARRGNVAMTFAIASVPIMAAVGGAVDYSSANSVKAAMQGALDSTALAMVKSASTLSSSQLTTNATGYFTAAFNRPATTSVQVTASYDASKSLLTLNSSAYVKTSFMGIVGLQQIKVAALSKATLGGSTVWPVCVLITDPDSNHTLLVKNLATIDFNNCMVQVNTQNWDAVEARDTSYIFTRSTA